MVSGDFVASTRRLRSCLFTQISHLLCSANVSFDLFVAGVKNLADQKSRCKHWSTASGGRFAANVFALIPTPQCEIFCASSFVAHKTWPHQKCNRGLNRNNQRFVSHRFRGRGAPKRRSHFKQVIWTLFMQSWEAFSLLSMWCVCGKAKAGLGHLSMWKLRILSTFQS